MALSCQKNSYLKEGMEMCVCTALQRQKALTTKVKSCEAKKLKLVVNGKKETIDGFEIILDDTVLFPEGGGQINDVEVLSVTRRGAEAVHFTRSPLDVTTEVHVVVDWGRRFDHMQQHSGQHLVTAIADCTFGYPTTSWYLGEKISTIELDTPSMTSEQRDQLELLVNEKIRASISMYPRLYESKDDPALAEVRTRGLPDDHVGPVRVVTIEGVENNMCCGTHVSNLSHLQAIKILAVEKGKKNKINLVFVAGERVLKYLGKCYDNEKTLNTLLRGPPEQHVELVDKLQKNAKQANKNALTFLRELAVMEAERFMMKEDRGLIFSQHRKDGDNEYMSIICNQISDEKVVKFLSVGDEKGSGMFLLAGPENIVTELGPKVAELLEGKGAGKNGRFQGKANKLSNRSRVEKILQDYLNQHEQ